jgi:hypothetical protein
MAMKPKKTKALLKKSWWWMVQRFQPMRKGGKSASAP